MLRMDGRQNQKDQLRGYCHNADKKLMVTSLWEVLKEMVKTKQILTHDILTGQMLVLRGWEKLIMTLRDRGKDS